MAIAPPSVAMGRRLAQGALIAALATACAKDHDAARQQPTGAVSRSGDAADLRAPVAGAKRVDQEAWRSLSRRATLEGWEPTRFGGEGNVAVQDDRIVIESGSPLSGITCTAAASDLPHGDYELEVIAARIAGSDFFCGLTFPIGPAALTLVLGGWGGSVCGLSCLDGEDAAHNETRTLRHFELGREYKIRIELLRGRLRAFVDDELLLACDLRGRELALRPEVELSAPLGIATFATHATVRDVRWRPLQPSVPSYAER